MLIESCSGGDDDDDDDDDEVATKRHKKPVDGSLVGCNSERPRNILNIVRLCLCAYVFNQSVVRALTKQNHSRKLSKFSECNVFVCRRCGGNVALVLLVLLVLLARAAGRFRRNASWVG